MNPMMKSVVCLSVLAFVVALALDTPAVGQVPSGRVAIMNVNSGLCLSPAGGNTLKNDQVVQYTCDHDPARFWSFTVISGDVVEITNLNSGLCLTVAGGNTSNNDPSVQYTCDSDPSRRWHYTKIDANTIRLVNVHSNLCLTVAGGNKQLNDVAVQYPCDGDPSRNWKIVTAQ
jgi:cytolethal distending toxin subunit A